MHIAYVPVSTIILKYCIKVYYLRYDIGEITYLFVYAY